MVDSPNLDACKLAIRQDDRFKQRFNVAASRARDQMWVVYSLDRQADLQEGDLRRWLIEYALDPEATLRALHQESESAQAQSPFVKEVLKRLIFAGYRVYAQWQVGCYRIDLVVEGGGQRVAVRWGPLASSGEDSRGP